jgi:squalene-hopene/tetraprenyl-beta-curcumene cyclase
MNSPRRLLLSLALLCSATGQAVAQPRDYSRDLRSPAYDPKEAVRPTFSLAKATEYLDVAARDWMLPRSCGNCHANFSYVLARPLLKTGSSAALDDTRRYLEERVKIWDKPWKEDGTRLRGEVVTLAAALAFDDARTGTLRSVTRQALDRMWSFQESEGGWPIDGCGSGLVAELTPQYGVALAIVAANIAPEGYAQTARARSGLEKTRRYVRSTMKDATAMPQDRALGLWAAAYQTGLLNDAERDAIVQALLAKQHKDGGWSSMALSRNVHRGVPEPPSDGQGTGFVVYMLRQAGVPARQPEISRAVRWLRDNQRVSGRWFTPVRRPGQTTEADFGTRDFYNQTVGTAFALLALESCGELGSSDARARVRASGLALRDRLLLDEGRRQE